MSFCMQQRCVALARNTAFSRPARLAAASRSFCKATPATASRQISSTAAMDLQSSVPHKELTNALRGVVPSLTNDTYKGQSGKVGVLGGCREYTGAPFFAAMSSLRMGCDLAYVFCTPSAAHVIKGYSPELIVLPDLIDREEVQKLEKERGAGSIHGNGQLRQMFRGRMLSWMKRLSVLIIGPGLGDDPYVGDCMREAVSMARELNLPLIIDGSGLNFVAQEPDIVRGYSNCLLTPNIAEFGRLAEAVGVELDGKIGVQWQQQSRQLAAALGGPILVSKGTQDVITDGQQLLVVQAEGSPRRCGGQGDVLTGTTAAFVSWALAKHRNREEQERAAAAGVPLLMLAAYGGCLAMRASALLSFRKIGRSMVAEDMLKQLGDPVLRYAMIDPPDSDMSWLEEPARL